MSELTDKLARMAGNEIKRQLQDRIDDFAKAPAQRDIYRRALEKIARTRSCDCWRDAQAALDEAQDAS
ncbi:MAG: hypothetical protein KGL39_11925 [Patescibacteria group bacterium]|nr:hypothetical protein [Patescibacteria group bacterium]